MEYISAGRVTRRSGRSPRNAQNHDLPTRTMPQPLNIAIVGGGPAGLGAAIAFLKLDNVTVKVFEQASELKEVGAVSTGSLELVNPPHILFVRRVSVSTITHGEF